MADCRIGENGRAKVAAAWEGVLDRIEAGDRVDMTLEHAGVTRGMVRAYLRDTPGARAEWDAAREASADAYFDQLAAITDNPGPDAAIARVKQQGLMWMAAKRDPRRYSEKAQLDVNVRTVDLTRIIEAANARLAAAQVGRVIEAQALPQLAELL